MLHLTYETLAAYVTAAAGVGRGLGGLLDAGQPRLYVLPRAAPQARPVLGDHCPPDALMASEDTG